MACYCETLPLISRSAQDQVEAFWGAASVGDQITLSLSHGAAFCI